MDCPKKIRTSVLSFRLCFAVHSVHDTHFWIVAIWQPNSAQCNSLLNVRTDRRSAVIHSISFVDAKKSKWIFFMLTVSYELMPQNREQRETEKQRSREMTKRELVPKSSIVSCNVYRTTYLYGVECGLAAAATATPIFACEYTPCVGPWFHGVRVFLFSSFFFGLTVVPSTSKSDRKPKINRHE